MGTLRDAPPPRSAGRPPPEVAARWVLAAARLSEPPTAACCVTVAWHLLSGGGLPPSAVAETLSALADCVAAPPAEAAAVAAAAARCCPPQPPPRLRAADVWMQRAAAAWRSAHAANAQQQQQQQAGTKPRLPALDDGWGEGRLGGGAVVAALQELHVRGDTLALRDRVAAAEAALNNRLAFADFARLYYSLALPPAAVAAACAPEICGEDGAVEDGRLKSFFYNVQGRPPAVAGAAVLQLKNDWAARSTPAVADARPLTADDVARCLASPEHNSWVDARRCVNVADDMRQPLHNYYIAAAAPQQAQQLQGAVAPPPPAADPVAALAAGCRWVEVGCVEGAGMVPLLATAGDTRSREVLQSMLPAAAESAFKASDFPAVLQLTFFKPSGAVSGLPEAQLQRNLGAALRRGLGRKLRDAKGLPAVLTPEALKGSVLVALPAADKAWEPELSSCAALRYRCCATATKALSACGALQAASHTVAVLPASAAGKGADESFARLVQRHLVATKTGRASEERLHPAGQLWAHGVQIVQCDPLGAGRSSLLHRSLFAENGGCGYVLRPERLRQPPPPQPPQGAAAAAPPPPGAAQAPRPPPPCAEGAPQLSVTVICGCNLPNAASPADLQVEVSVSGAEEWEGQRPHPGTPRRSSAAPSPGASEERWAVPRPPAEGPESSAGAPLPSNSPVWNLPFAFPPITAPDAAFLVLRVIDRSSTMRVCCVAEAAAPLRSLSGGLRAVPLRTPTGEPLRDAAVICRIALEWPAERQPAAAAAVPPVGRVPRPAAPGRSRCSGPEKCTARAAVAAAASIVAAAVPPRRLPIGARWDRVFDGLRAARAFRRTAVPLTPTTSERGLACLAPLPETSSSSSRPQQRAAGEPPLSPRRVPQAPGSLTAATRRDIISLPGLRGEHVRRLSGDMPAAWAGKEGDVLDELASNLCTGGLPAGDSGGRRRVVRALSRCAAAWLRRSRAAPSSSSAEGAARIGAIAERLWTCDGADLDMLFAVPGAPQPRRGSRLTPGERAEYIAAARGEAISNCSAPPPSQDGITALAAAAEGQGPLGAKWVKWLALVSALAQAAESEAVDWWRGAPFRGEAERHAWLACGRGALVGSAAPAPVTRSRSAAAAAAGHSAEGAAGAALLCYRGAPPVLALPGGEEGVLAMLQYFVVDEPPQRVELEGRRSALLVVLRWSGSALPEPFLREVGADAERAEQRLAAAEPRRSAQVEQSCSSEPDEGTSVSASPSASIGEGPSARGACCRRASRVAADGGRVVVARSVGATWSDEEGDCGTPGCPYCVPASPAADCAGSAAVLPPQELRVGGRRFVLRQAAAAAPPPAPQQGEGALAAAPLRPPQRPAAPQQLHRQDGSSTPAPQGPHPPRPQRPASVIPLNGPLPPGNPWGPRFGVGAHYETDMRGSNQGRWRVAHLVLDSSSAEKVTVLQLPQWQLRREAFEQLADQKLVTFVGALSARELEIWRQHWRAAEPEHQQADTPSRPAGQSARPAGAARSPPPAAQSPPGDALSGCGGSPRGGAADADAVLPPPQLQPPERKQQQQQPAPWVPPAGPLQRSVTSQPHSGTPPPAPVPTPQATATTESPPPLTVTATFASDRPTPAPAATWASDYPTPAATWAADYPTPAATWASDYPAPAATWTSAPATAMQRPPAGARPEAQRQLTSPPRRARPQPGAPRQPGDPLLQLCSPERPLRYVQLEAR